MILPFLPFLVTYYGVSFLNKHTFYVHLTISTQKKVKRGGIVSIFLWILCDKEYEVA